MGIRPASLTDWPFQLRFRKGQTVFLQNFEPATYRDFDFLQSLFRCLSVSDKAGDFCAFGLKPCRFRAPGRQVRISRQFVYFHGVVIQLRP